MNRDCAEFARIYSDNGIYEAFYTEIGKSRQSPVCRLRARMAELFRVMVAFLCSVRVRRFMRVGCATLALIGAVGIAGSLETGRLSPVSALLLAAGFLAVVYLALKPARRKSKVGKKETEKTSASIGTVGRKEPRKCLADAGCRFDSL